MNKFSAICGASTVLLAGIGLVGWYTNNLILASFGSHLLMMAPSTAICFCILGYCLLSLGLTNTDKSRSLPPLRTLAMIAAGISLFELVSFLAGVDSLISHILSGTNQRLGRIPIGRMSPVTATLLLFSSFCIVLTSTASHSNSTLSRNIASSLSFLTLLAGSLLIIGYGYGVPLFYNSSFIPPALPTSVCFSILSVGIFYLTGTSSSLFGIYFGHSIFARLVRNLLPSILVFVFLDGWFDAINLQLSANPAIDHSVFSLTTALFIIAVVLTQSRKIDLQLASGNKATRLAEDALIHSEDRFRRAIVSAPFPIMLHADNGEVLAISRGWTHASGYTLDDIPTTPDWTEHAYGVRKQMVQEEIDALYGLKERKDEGEYPVICKDGSIQIWDFSSAPLGGLLDGRRAVISMAKDITERKRAEKHLEDQRSLLRTLVDTIPDEISVKDLERRFVLVNPATVRALGKESAEEILGKKDEDLIPEEFANVARLQEEQVIATGKPVLNVEGETRLDPITGEIKRAILTTKAPFLGKDGTATGLLVINRDITEFKRSEAALRESEERYRSLYNNTPVMLYSIDAQGNLISVSDYWLNTLGYTRDEVLGRKSSEFLTEASRQYANDTVLPAFRKTGYCNNIEYQFLKKNGEVLQTLLSAISEMDEHGILVRSLSVLTDITELRAIEKRLRQTEKMESIGQLAGGIAHDFNNVLLGIVGYTEMSLQHARKDSTLERNLLKIMSASDRATQLVKQILTFSRQGIPQKSVISIWPIMKEALDLLRASIPSSVVIEADLSIETKPVLGDSTKIHEMILNLASNAVQAMDRKGILKVRLYPASLDQAIHGRIGEIAPGQYSVIEVTDTGGGMDAKTLTKAFEPFYTTKAVGAGTGMGLSVVLGIVQVHGADVQVESAPGKGSTFRIYFPVTEASVSTAANETERINPTGTERILLVDDEQMLLETAKALLTTLGYTVTCISDSRDALEFIREKGAGIDILVTDQTMPGMTGIELAKAALKIRQDLPIIICTGYSSEINPERAAAIGISQFIMKPYASYEIGKVIRDVLDKNKTGVVL